MAGHDPVGIRLLTRNGHDWAPRPLIVEAVNALSLRSCLIDGEESPTKLFSVYRELEIGRAHV